MSLIKSALIYQGFGYSIDLMRGLWHQTIQEEGGRCPCCDRWGKVNGHAIIETMAMALLWLSRQPVNDEGFVDTKKAPAWMVKGKYSLLRHWGLTLKADKQNKKTKGEGLWQVTPKGYQFLRNDLAIPKKVYIYDNALQGFSAEEVYFRDCFGKHFDYQQVMSDSFNLNNIKA
jgi:hypothetical protein